MKEIVDKVYFSPLIAAITLKVKSTVDKNIKRNSGNQ